MGAVGVGLTRWASTRREGTPSYRMDRLQELGESARLGYRLLASADAPGLERHRATYERICRERADAYDAALGEALDGVELVRAEMGDAAAEVLTLRYIDGETWRATAEAVGLTASQASATARRALDLLDAMAGA